MALVKNRTRYPLPVTDALTLSPGATGNVDPEDPRVAFLLSQAHLQMLDPHQAPFAHGKVEAPTPLSEPLPYAVRTQYPDTSRQSDGTVTGQNAQVIHRVAEAVIDPQLVYVNVVGNPIRVTARLIGTDGTGLPVFFNGQASVVIPSYATVVSDPIPAHLETGVNFTTRTFVEAGAAVPGGSAGDKWARHIRVKLTGEGQTSSAGETNGVNGVISGGLNNFVLGPCAILGRARLERPARIFALVGDSILDGQTDSMTSLEFWGFGVRALGSQYGYVNLSRGGESTFDFTGTNATNPRLRFLSWATDAIDNYSTNDFSGGRTHAQVAAERLSIWGTCLARGHRVYATTCTPRETLTAPQAAERVTHNAWLRDGAPIVDGAAVAPGTSGALRAGDKGHPLVAVADVAVTVEDGTTNTWAAGTSSDGTTHPNGVGAALMAEALSAVLPL